MQSSTWYCTTCGAANDVGKTNCFACAQPHIEDAQETPDADLLQGRYRLLTQVGVGGFGVVFKALDTQSADRTVAVKQINLRGLTPQKMIEATDAFNREVQHLTPLKHPNLPGIYDHFTDPDHWYLVMEFIEGETLEHYLETCRLQRAYTASRTFLPLEEFFPLAFQLCEVLTYLHTRHPPIIFRDIKPANIMRTGKGHLYLIDFGIARHFKPGQARDTTPLGSPGYAAPEQYGKAQTTPRADLFSLGALLHHLVTGEDPAEMLFQFAPLTDMVGADIQKLDTLIRRMVDVDSDKRPVSASEVKEELQSIARLAANSAPRIWYPPEGQTPSSSMTADTFKLPSAGLQQVQAQLQKPQGTSRRKFLTRSVIGGAVVVIGTITLGPALLSLSDSFSWHRSMHSTTGFPTTVQQLIRPAIVWSPDGKRVSFVSADGSFAQVYSIDSTGALVYLAKLQDKIFTGSISALAWSPDNLIIATGNTDGNIDIWFINSKPGPVDSFPLNYPDNSGAIDMIAWSPNSKLIASSGPQRTLRVSDSEVAGIVSQRPIAINGARLLSWSPDSKHIVIESDAPSLQSSDPSLQVYDLKAGKVAFTFAEVARVNMVKAAWSPDGKTIASLGDNGNLFLWDASDGSYFGIHWQTGGTFIDLLWSPDSKRIALETENGNLQVWNIQDDITTYYLVHPNRIRASIWLHDGRIALIDDTKALQYINVIE